MNSLLLEKTQSLLKRFDHGIMHPEHVLLAAVSMYGTKSDELNAQEQSLREKCKALKGLPKYASDTLEITEEAKSFLTNIRGTTQLFEALGLETSKATEIGTTEAVSDDKEEPPAITINTDFDEINSQLKRAVQGQDHAIDAVVNRLAVFVRELDVRPERPNGVFLFAGPTGVGKTELARNLARTLYGDEENLIRIDMSEYYHPAEIGRLIGSAPGYVGYDQPDSWITTRISKKPHAVLLLDEVEKAHPIVWNTFLQIFDAGVLTDGRGVTASFKDIVIVLTTNIGAEKFESKNPIGLVHQENTSSEETAVRSEIRNWFRPELINRLDEIVVFKPLTAEIIRKIASNQIESAATRLKASGYHFEIGEDLIDFIATNGFDRQYGARPLLRAVESHMLAPLAVQVPGTFKYQIENNASIKWHRSSE